MQRADKFSPPRRIDQVDRPRSFHPKQATWIAAWSRIRLMRSVASECAVPMLVNVWLFRKETGL